MCWGLVLLTESLKYSEFCPGHRHVCPGLAVWVGEWQVICNFCAHRLAAAEWSSMVPHSCWAWAWLASSVPCLHPSQTLCLEPSSAHSLVRIHFLMQQAYHHQPFFMLANSFLKSSCLKSNTQASIYRFQSSDFPGFSTFYTIIMQPSKCVPKNTCRTYFSGNT